MIMNIKQSKTKIEPRIKLNRNTYTNCKWFEPRSISSSCSVIVRVSVVLKRTVGDSDYTHPDDHATRTTYTNYS